MVFLTVSTVPKSYAFITAYLLGVERRILEREYIEDYVFSEGLDKFKNIKNAELIRALSKIKQSIIRNYSVYKDCEDFSTSSKGFLDKEMDILKENNIDLHHVFRLSLDIADVLNAISKHINNLLPEVFDYVKMPYADKVASLFYLYELNKKSLNKLVNSIKGSWSKFPHGIVIVKGSKVSNQLPYVLDNDRNLYEGCHNLVGEDYVETGQLPIFAWGTIKSREVEQLLPITKSSTIYVDCDNTDYFKFLSVLECLNRSTEKGHSHHIKLYMDDMTSPLWKLSEKLLKGCFTFEFIEVNRIKDNKSVVDIVMASHITRDSINNPDRLQGIISSDSDFFGLIETGLNLFIFYDGVCTNQEYVSYLKRKKLTTFDISTIDTNDTRFEFKQTVISYLCLSCLANLPMNKWSVNDLAEYVTNGFDKDICYGMSLHVVESLDVAKKVLSNLEIKVNGSKIALSSLGVEVEVELKAS